MTESKYSVRSVERAMEVLIALGEKSPLRITELANRLDLHKSTVHRLLVTLEARSFVEKDPTKGGYRLGLRLFQLGSAVSSRLEICQEAKPYLEELSKRTGYTVHLVVLSGYEPIYIDKVENPCSYVKYSHIGKKLPIHATAAGKLLLAHLTEQEINKILAKNFLPYTKNTMVDAKILRKHLEEIKKVGYSLDLEELEIGLCCIAAPVRNSTGSVIAAVSLSGMGATITQESLPLLINQVKEVAQKVSFRLGYDLDRMV